MLRGLNVSKGRRVTPLPPSPTPTPSTLRPPHHQTIRAFSFFVDHLSHLNSISSVQLSSNWKTKFLPTGDPLPRKLLTLTQKKKKDINYMKSATDVLFFKPVVNTAEHWCHRRSYVVKRTDYSLLQICLHQVANEILIFKQTPWN